MDEQKIKIIGWISIGFLGLGQVFPWGRTVPVEQAWDWLFSSFSSPNIEWWIWLLAPVVAIIFGVKGLMQSSSIPRIILVPVGIFIVAWAGLFLTGIRQYIDFEDLGFLFTFIGMLAIGALAIKGE